MIDNNSYLDLSNYKIISIIGNGELSQVMKVQEIKTGKIYIAKISHQELDKSIEKQKLSKEINYLLQLDHPSVIKFFGYSPYDFNHEEHMVILTENIPNGTLYQQISNKQNKNFDDTKKLINIYGIASAMSYLHSKDILHRDLNPNNILEDSNYYPKVTNFGFSQLYIKNINQSMRLNGTPAYSAPEVIKRDLYSKLSDVYSFAITVYFILTGSIPSNLFSSFSNELKLPPTFPKSYSDLISSCLSFDPSLRPSFDDIVSKLKEDNGFITDSINKEEYFAYIRYIESNGKEEEEEESQNHSFVQEEVDDSEMNSPFSLNVNNVDISGYQKRERIGGGSYSDVYKIIKTGTNDLFAAKVSKDIMNENSKNTSKGISLSREVNILSQHQHPFILKFIGYSPISFNEVMKPVIVTEYLQNNSLERILEIERNGIQIPHWNETTKLIIIYGIAFIMSYLHSQDILHRDLKPANILIDDFLFPKLSDFGFSMKISQNEDDYESCAIGTAPFISPEIFSEYKYTKSADVYAFAIIMYEILNSKFPFENLSCNQIIYEVCFKKERPELTNKVNQRFQKLIELCWHQNNIKRPSFDEIVELLKKDREFISENVNEKLYYGFIEFTEQLKKNKPEIKRNKHFMFEKHLFNFSYRKNIDDLSSLSIDDYEKLNLISQEDISSTFRVVEKSTGKIYSAEASKISISCNLTQEEIKNISEEVDILSKLKHPSIQQFRGFSILNFKHHLKPVIINEYLEARTLFDILEKQRNGEIDSNWNDTKKLVVIYGIASGMHYLHSHNIVLYNLNPKNIIIDDKYHPKIKKIGFYTQIQNSRFFTSRSTKEFNEIPFYTAPEILKNENNNDGKSSDVYSFSLVVYEILSNEFPYANIKSAKQFYSEVVNKNYRPSFNKKIDGEYRGLIEDCWSQDISKRPSFNKIVHMLENDSSFVNNSIEKTEYMEFISCLKCNDN